MGHLQAFRQDVRRVLGNKMKYRGPLGEMQRLEKRINSGELTWGERKREMEKFQRVGYELGRKLEDDDTHELADEAYFIAEYGPRDSFDMPDTDEVGNLDNVAKEFFGY